MNTEGDVTFPKERADARHPCPHRHPARPVVVPLSARHEGFAAARCGVRGRPCGPSGCPRPGRSRRCRRLRAAARRPLGCCLQARVRQPVQDAGVRCTDRSARARGSARGAGLLLRWPSVRLPAVPSVWCRTPACPPAADPPAGAWQCRRRGACRPLFPGGGDTPRDRTGIRMRARPSRRRAVGETRGRSAATGVNHR